MRRRPTSPSETVVPSFLRRSRLLARLAERSLAVHDLPMGERLARWEIISRLAKLLNYESTFQATEVVLPARPGALSHDLVHLMGLLNLDPGAPSNVARAEAIYDVLRREGWDPGRKPKRRRRIKR